MQGCFYPWDKYFYSEKILGSWSVWLSFIILIAEWSFSGFAVLIKAWRLVQWLERYYLHLYIL